MQNNFYFIGNFSNIYKNPSKRSEVTSQIIHGEKFKILAKNKNWIKIKTLFDNYKGFIKNSKYIEKFRIWSLYYRTEIVWFIAGLVTGAIIL